VGYIISNKSHFFYNMASLADVSPGSSYPGLIKTSENTPISTFPGATVGFSTITDGEGNMTPLQISGLSVKSTYVGGTNPISSINMSARNIGHIQVRDGIVFAVPDGANLVIIDFTNPSIPRILSDTPSIGGSRYATIQGNYLFASGRIIDISNLSYPVQVSSFLGSNSQCSIGKLLITSNWEGGNGDRIFDISDPISPVLTYTFPWGGQDHGFSNDGKYYYRVGFNNSTFRDLEIWNIEDPYGPQLVSVLPGDFYGENETSNGYNFIAQGTRLIIVDINDPFNPRVVTYKNDFFPIDFTYFGRVQIRGNFMFSSNNETGGICVTDITDIANPIYLGLLPASAGSPRDFFVEGNYIYITSRESPFPISVHYIGGLISHSANIGNLKSGRIFVDSDLVVGKEITTQKIISDDIVSRGEIFAKDGITTRGTILSGSSVPDSLTSLEINSTTKGMLLPRMTSDQRGNLTKITSIGLTAGGTGYLNGTYQRATLTGGSGQGAKAQLVITGGSVTSASITNGGNGYKVSDSLSVNNSTISSFSSIRTLNLTSGGSGYNDGFYTGVTLTGLTGALAFADLNITGGSVSSITVTQPGIGYSIGSQVSANNDILGTGGTGFLATVSSIGTTGSGFSATVQSVTTTEGLTIYNTSTSTLDIYTGATSGWNSFGSQTLIKGATSGSDTYHLVTFNSEGATGISIANDLKVSMNGPLRITGMPTSSSGLPSGTLWSDPSDSYTVKMVP
jgi:hypothetical protein